METFNEFEKDGTKDHIIDYIDNFNINIGQARAVLSALILDDAFTNLSSCNVANLLSAIGDRLDDVANVQCQFFTEILST
ncbi:hypothetical protein [Rheinheimera salexigens]|uniref:Uncharacterized protein n=1 Tax=Rheinheimera salexigens TaxID=1628148 RepID=A0A1E7Q889_9GAMM|nr:hypothetical protein [Rheinheimera salexigens]OEY70330.1 hypothetical protein BI198_12685 [Rheinheimera salexigens]